MFLSVQNISKKLNTAYVMEKTLNPKQTWRTGAGERTFISTRVGQPTLFYFINSILT